MRAAAREHRGGMTTPVYQRTTTAYYVQAILAFAVSSTATIVGIARMPGTPWMRAFAALGLLFVITSTFTLAKCVRDRQEIGQVTSRIDQARMEKLLADHDPYKREQV